MSDTNTNTNKKVALVTGASAGIGKAVARRLLADGWTVYGGARRVEQMADIQSEGAKIVSLDVTDDASLEGAVQTILDAEERIDALVNNAGVDTQILEQHSPARIDGEVSSPVGHRIATLSSR